MIVPARRRFPRSLNYRVRGFGDLASEGFESCDPRDVACVSRNAARGIARDQAGEIARADDARAACERDAALNPDLPNNCAAWWPSGYAGGIPAPNTQAINPQAYAESFLTPDQAVANVFSPNTIGGFTYHSPTTQARPASAAAASVPSPGARGGQVAFSTSRGGTALYVGDTWTVTISGASPNATVKESGFTHGSTDASGNFSKSGTFDESAIGSWSEVWTVGGAPSGSFSFTVAAAPKTPAGQVIINSSGAQSAPGSSAGPSTLNSGFSFSSIPTWGWLAAAAGAFFMLRGNR